MTDPARHLDDTEAALRVGPKFATDGTETQGAA